MRKAILCLEPEEPVSHMVTVIVIQLELPLNREGERVTTVQWEGERNGERAE